MATGILKYRIRNATRLEGNEERVRRIIVTSAITGIAVAIAPDADLTNTNLNNARLQDADLRDAT